MKLEANNRETLRLYESYFGIGSEYSLWVRTYLKKNWSI